MQGSALDVPCALPGPTQSPEAEAAIRQLLQSLVEGGSGAGASAGSAAGEWASSVLAGSRVLQLGLWHSLPTLVQAAAAVEGGLAAETLREVGGRRAVAGGGGGARRCRQAAVP